MDLHKVTSCEFKVQGVERVRRGTSYFCTDETRFTLIFHQYMSPSLCAVFTLLKLPFFRNITYKNNEQSFEKYTVRTTIIRFETSSFRHPVETLIRNLLVGDNRFV